MIDLLKKSAACAFAIISAVFTFVPEAIFEKIILISEDVLKQISCYCRRSLSKIRRLILSGFSRFLCPAGQ